jgi:cytochrome c5
MTRGRPRVPLPAHVDPHAPAGRRARRPGVPAVDQRQPQPLRRAERHLAAGVGPQRPSFPGRTGTNAKLADDFAATRGPSGLEVVSPNCLQCHAGKLLGKPVLGLGNSALDETVDPSAIAQFARNFLPPGNARTELERFLTPVAAVGPRIVTDTVGVSSADDLAVTLMAHRDAKTLKWKPEAEPPLDDEPPVPVDVPAWWLARDKKSVFATGIGRGDRATLMASASLLCTDSVKEAERIIAAFGPVPKYVDSIQPPKWPWHIDAARAELGKALYEKRCAGCHEKAEVIPLEKVKTDPLLASRTATDAAPRLAWFNASVYGKTAKLEATNGYVAQPLRGVWATAPYLHNGSVPTLAALLDSKTRPEKWSRSFDSMDYDANALGWRFTIEQEKTSARVYDTTKRGFGNGGHTFGDALSADERGVLLEFLKTL